MGWLGEEQSRCQERFEQFDDNVVEGDEGEDVNVVEYDVGGYGKADRSFLRCEHRDAIVPVMWFSSLTR